MRDYFKESVAALKAAAAVDARLRRSADDAGLLDQAVGRYAEAVQLLQGAVDPGNAKVSGKAKDALKVKLAASQKRLDELESKLAASGGGAVDGRAGAVAGVVGSVSGSASQRLPAPLLPKLLTPAAKMKTRGGGATMEAAPIQDYFKASVAALKDAAALDSQLKQDLDDAELRDETVRKYRAALDLLRGAVDPANAKVPGPMKKALVTKLKATEKRLGELDPSFDPAAAAAVAVAAVAAAASTDSAAAAAEAAAVPGAAAVSAAASIAILSRSLSSAAFPTREREAHPSLPGKPVPAVAAVPGTPTVAERVVTVTNSVDPTRDYFKESVSALKEAAAADARHKRHHANGAMQVLAAQKYRAAAELLLCAIDPANKRVPARTKATLQAKLKSVESRLQEISSSTGSKAAKSPGARPTAVIRPNEHSMTGSKQPDATATWGLPHGGADSTPKGKDAARRGEDDDDALFATPKADVESRARMREGGASSGGVDEAGGDDDLRSQVELLHEQMARMEEKHRDAISNVTQQYTALIDSMKASLATQEAENVKFRQHVLLQIATSQAHGSDNGENAEARPTATKQHSGGGDAGDILVSEISNIDIERFVENERRVRLLEEANVDLVRGASIALERLR